MRIYPKQTPAVARDIIKALMDGGDIEVEKDLITEAQKDLAAVMGEFMRREREVNDLTRDVLASRGWSASQFGEARKIAAASRKLPHGDEAVDYVINQMLENLLISANVAEVFAEDHVMRKRIVDVIRHHQKIDAEVETEVRQRIKNVEEGTREWDVVYRKIMEEVLRNKGLI